jgi:hypothetical protein
MKAHLLQAAAFTLLLITSACKEEQFTPLNFDGFTRTNESCAIIGQADPSRFYARPTLDNSRRIGYEF